MRRCFSSRCHGNGGKDVEDCLLMAHHGYQSQLQHQHQHHLLGWDVLKAGDLVNCLH